MMTSGVLHAEPQSLRTSDVVTKLKGWLARKAFRKCLSSGIGVGTTRPPGEARVERRLLPPGVVEGIVPHGGGTAAPAKVRVAEKSPQPPQGLSPGVGGRPLGDHSHALFPDDLVEIPDPRRDHRRQTAG